MSKTAHQLTPFSGITAVSLFRIALAGVFLAIITCSLSAEPVSRENSNTLEPAGAKVGLNGSRGKASSPRKIHKTEQVSADSDKRPIVEQARSTRSKEPADPGELGRLNYARLLRSTAWVIIRPSDSWHNDGWGSGWLLDRKNKLLVTNHHVVAAYGEVAKDEEVRVYFPQSKDGQLVTERQWYYDNGKGYTGKVIDSDPRRDLAVIQMKSLPDDIQALPLVLASPRPGDRLYSLGNPGASDAAWVYTMGSVRQVYQKRFNMTTGQECDYKTVETQSPTNSGDSGGPVINDDGQLVAVCSAGSDDANLMEIFVDMSEVRGYESDVRKMLAAKTADELNARGVHYYERGRYELAVRDFSTAHKLDPQMSDALGNRGWCFLQMEDFETAIADFDDAIKLTDKDANYFQGRGRARLATEDYDKAIADFTKAIRIDPQTAEYYEDRADVYLEQDFYEKAIADYTRAIGPAIYR